jgi:hypothetical protein
MRSERNLGSLTVDETDVHGENLLLLCVKDDGEIERMGVLVIVGRSTIIHQTLLKSSLITPSIIKPDSPSINKDLLHIGDTQLLTSANHSGILTSDTLTDIKILEGKSGTDIRDILPLFDFTLADVGNDFRDLAISALNHDSESATSGTRTCTGFESGVFSLEGLAEGEAVELQGFGGCIAADQFCRGADLVN